ncbi:unnamed protein product [Thlaspi arvense]|uniref:Uncharacterized protein n=1 Tax=Thlaspi arvense TaxID=13288 RepID=A0AAU9RQS3_THLAR|nr:unnamed protein product [Thlaspi arvense]
MEAMENRLCEAAITGNVESLHEILQDDKLILDKFVVRCFGWTPLHVAVSLGHADFMIELLHLQPKLAQVLDSAGQSPLHLAAAAQVSDPASQSQLHLVEAPQVLDSAGQSPIAAAAQVSDSASQSPIATAAQVSDSGSRSSVATATQVSDSVDQSALHLAAAIATLIL